MPDNPRHETTPPDWKAHAVALAAAIQRFRNDRRLKHATALRKGAGYVAMCDAWDDYKEDGGPVLAGEDIEHGKR